jgi:hypothetical protein
MRQFKVKHVQEILLFERPDSVLALIHSGELPATNVSRNPRGRPSWRIAEDDLDAFLESRRAVPPTPPARRPRRKAMVEKIPAYI